MCRELLTLFRSYSMRRDMITAQLAARNVPYFYHHFHDYGCYCIAQNLETNPLKNRGRPLDDVDAICQAHSKCQQCVYADSNGSINPKSTGYQMTVDKTSGDIVCQGKSAYPKKFQQVRHFVKCAQNILKLNQTQNWPVSKLTTPRTDQTQFQIKMA